ncbi:MAG: hypothetical protein JW956_04900 [Calditrichaceae bacterium]|nr:hypothetical protein [Calditrichaceae bacterium]
MILSTKHFKTIMFSMIVLIFMLSSLMATAPVDEGKKVYRVKNDGPLYTAYNIWYELGKENALWCINYKRGEMIPAGTEVTDVKIVEAESGRFLGGEEKAISFRTVNTGKEFLVNFKPAFHPDLTIDDYMDKMFTSKDFDELTEGMSQYEIDAIKEGKAKVRMSKESILVSFGYPPEHRTPDIEKNVWLYWMTRFETKDIHFDENGLTYRQSSDPDEL